ncbi:D-alanine--D-alanine ligase [Candidatus Koribacter versatilis Ellin345]|uniref:D-alanine--D-alanine ligase n=1 Tax=Koribacter versatilis (strain Ellin345) TaxID=204669 RepID=Q1IHQ8_KORVE|nr:D-alanine--D-alanine ligase [Candidatus Koribacter versatilis]ABF43592.1 D-alanine--D-alanine ligase [Candidatus Koribacter versatilis Ellin345]
MAKKIRVGVLFGGRSGEHDVSLLSAASVINAVDKKKFEVVPIGITKEGKWLTASHAESLLNGKKAEQQLRAGDPEATPGAAVLAKGEAVLVPPVPQSDRSAIVPFETDAAGHSASSIDVDVIFPVLHGTFGEDGTIQGLFELANIPYVGAGVLGSAAGMDKDIMKALFKNAGLPIVKHMTVLRSQWQREPKKVKKLVESKLKYPVFVKPANLGSSVGISKAHDSKELGPALDEAAKFDRKLVIEQGVGGKKKKAREIECSVLGNDEPKASVPGEIVPIKEFYDYAAKYLDEGSALEIPAKLPKSTQKQVQELAIRAFQAVDGSGLGRVDFLIDPKSNKLYVNEINTMPGFTSISMYPKLWEASGLKYTDLITRLIELALERHADKQKNQYTKD